MKNIALLTITIFVLVLILIKLTIVTKNLGYASPINAIKSELNIEDYGNTVVDLKFKPACESSGGTWFEKKGKDLPPALCQCPYNDWLEKNMENVVSSGCDCNTSCFGLDDDFPKYDFEAEASKPKPPYQPGQGVQVILREDVSNCEYKANINNSCQLCKENSDCGSFSSNGSRYWIRESVRSICEKSMCKFKRTIYYDQYGK